MPGTPTKLQRWLDLIAYLVGRRLPVTVDELMERVPAYAARWQGGDETARASARRMFERDKDELRRAGIPIRTVRYSVNFGREELEGYRLDRRDFYLPYVRLVAGAPRGPSRAGSSAVSTFELRPEELGTALTALRHVAALPSFPYAGEARSALRKLTFDLERGVEDDAAPVTYLERPGAAELRGVLRDLSDALLSRKRVRFRYHGLYRDEETERDVAPYALLYQQGQWYLIGHDRTRDDVRVFRVGRIQELHAPLGAPHTPDYVVPDSFRLEAYVGRKVWEFEGEGEPPMEATVRFRFPISLWAERAGHGRLVEARQDGSAVRTFQVHQVNPFVRWLLSLEDEVTVLEPPELRRLVQEMAGLVAARHRLPEDGSDV